MSSRAAWGLALLAFVPGCLPELGQWTIAAEGADAGVAPGPDGGTGRQPTPIDLGRPCPSPHLVIGTTSSSSGNARVLRIDPATDTRCRESPALEAQRAFGSAVVDVDWHPDTGTVLGLASAVLALDAEGFPRWRHQEFGYSQFEGEWVAAFGRDASLRIAVAWSSRSTSLDSMVLLGADGVPTSGAINPPFFGMGIAAHPDGSARLIIPTRARALVEVYDVTDATTNLPDTSTTHLWPSGPDLPSMYGNRTHIATDVPTGRVVIAHERGIAHWQLGGAPPSVAHACPTYCGNFHAAAPDPSAADGAYAICVGTGTSTRHLVRVGPGRCDLVIDGTSMSGQTLQDVALVRASL